MGGRNLDNNPTVYKAPGDEDSMSYEDSTRWTGAPYPITITYGFLKNKSIDYLSQNDIKDAFVRAFAKWSSIIRVTFTEDNTPIPTPNIHIGFFHDFTNGNLVQTFLPPSGILHLNANVSWAIDFTKENSKDAFDLESVAMHAIGHVLGLDHSHSPDAIMYHEMSPGIKKVDFTLEDVVRAQHLYGPNPNYHFEAFAPPPEYHHQAPSDLPSGSSTILIKDLITTRFLGFVTLVWYAVLMIMTS